MGVLRKSYANQGFATPHYDPGAPGWFTPGRGNGGPGTFPGQPRFIELKNSSLLFVARSLSMRNSVASSSSMP